MKVPFFSKRKEKKAEERNQKRAEVEALFRQGVSLAEQINDPAQKVIGLQQVYDNIKGYLGGTLTEIKTKGKNTTRNTYWGSVGVIGSAGLTGTLLVTGPIGWGILGATLVGYGGAAVVGIKRGEKVQGQLMDESLSHISNMTSLQYAVANKIDATIAANVDAISASPLRERLLSVPSLSKKFTAAAEKHLQEIQNAAPVAQDKAAPVAEEKPAPSRVSDPRLLEENVFTKNHKKPGFGG